MNILAAALSALPLAKVNIRDALLNVLMGMLIVFVILILISFIISLFKYISVIQNKLTAKKAAKNQTLKENSTDAVFSQIEEKEEDDLELVAVISAAVAAYMGTSSTDGFVVRSIRRANGNKSKW